MSRSYIYSVVFFLGARVDIKDHLGRNFLHLIVQQPNGLKNLQPEFMQVIHTSVDGVPQAELDATESGFAYEFYYDERMVLEFKTFSNKDGVLFEYLVTT